MGVSCKYASSVLLCSEDCNSILGFGDEEGEQEVRGDVQRPDLCGSPQERSGLDGGILMGAALQSDDRFALLIEREVQHLPRGDYAERLQKGQLDLALRSDSIDWMQKVHSHYNFGPQCVYLSVNYLDRFLSSYDMPQGKAWITQLLSVACLSLAVKVEETTAHLPLDLQVVGEAKYVFEAKSIQKMELLILSTLCWKMQAVTPFAFIDYFLYKFREGKSPSCLMISAYVDLTLRTIRGINFLQFKPSEIAAAVALSAMKDQILDIHNALACCLHVNKERVLRCHELIQALAKNKTYKNATNASASSVSKTLNRVLDAASVSYESDDTTIGSHANWHASPPAAKRKKLNMSITAS